MEVNINMMEIIDELKKQIGELTQANIILNIKCRKIEQMIDECKCKEENK